MNIEKIPLLQAINILKKFIVLVFDFSHRVLRLSSGIEDMGPAHWDLSLSLLAAWIIAFFCMVKGIKSSGKVAIIFLNTTKNVILRNLKSLLRPVHFARPTSGTIQF